MDEKTLREISQSNAGAADRQRAFFNRVFGWMFAGLGVSALLAYHTAKSGVLLKNPNLPIVLFFATIALVFILSFAINKMSALVATLCFVGYAALNGVMLSSVLYVYTMSSVMQAFCATALMFGATGLYGYVTRRDLTSVGSFLFMALIGIIIASLLNMFFRSGALDFAISIIGVIIFVGLTAYDVQKIKQLAFAHGEGALDGETAEKASILGALTLYLDFINLFLYVLRFLGNRNNR